MSQTDDHSWSGNNNDMFDRTKMLLSEFVKQLKALSIIFIHPPNGLLEWVEWNKKMFICSILFHEMKAKADGHLNTYKARRRTDKVTFYGSSSMVIALSSS